ncbi:hypothetical protein HYC85_031293 [Camellia sinensis]|uniref:PGG domain-containing protein n=1 Tax=Camellia sinensis TaxID=4442 RepID=A0A7J7FQ81_CAMSI|nr:hypothetical protein HYC85_031293 [Camellia sinensis]
MMFIIENVKNKNWDGVLTFHKNKDGPVNVRITSTGEAVLHMAVRDRELEALEKLTEKVEMELADNRGNTCLHLAAKMGYTDGCIFLAKNKPDRIRNCNSDNETPLFLAALYGREGTFFVLAQICDNVYGHDITYEYGRRGSDGSTVLHCAINEDFLDLACSIMYRYPEFVHRVDQRGYSPLHLLACKTSSFRSCSRFTWLQQIIDSSVPDGNSWVRKVVESRLDRTANSNGKYIYIHIFVDLLKQRSKHASFIRI